GQRPPPGGGHRGRTRPDRGVHLGHVAPLGSSTVYGVDGLRAPVARAVDLGRRRLRGDAGRARHQRPPRAVRTSEEKEIPMPHNAQSRPEVAVVGSVNVDLVVTVARHARPGETILASGYAETVGGKGYNQAVAAAKHLSTHLIGCVGEDAFGERAIADAGRRGVETGGVARAGVPTGRALIEVSDDGENSIVVVPLANHEVTPE